ncbi:MAG: hypothetical protein OCD00_01455 [Colwellia sp.]
MDGKKLKHISYVTVIILIFVVGSNFFYDSKEEVVHKEDFTEEVFVNKAPSNLVIKKKSDSKKKLNIVECSEPVDPDNIISTKYFDKKVINLTNNIEELKGIIQKSNDPESQIVHTILSVEDSSELPKKLDSLYNVIPESPLLSYDLLSSCTIKDSKCNNSIFERGTELDAQNGAVWLMMAIHELNNNNIDKAKMALMEASNAPVFNEYWSEHFTLFESVFVQAGAGSDLPTQIAILSNISTIPAPNFSVLANFCDSLDASKTDILDTCLSIGQQMINSQSTMLSYLIGMNIQSSVYKKYGDTELLDQLEDMRENFDKLIESSVKADALMWQSRRRTADWLQQMRDIGEIGATEFIVNEAIELSSKSEFDPCMVDW